jgi:hypothetical protein
MKVSFFSPVSQVSNDHFAKTIRTDNETSDAPTHFIIKPIKSIDLYAASWFIVRMGTIRPY